ncbi:19096_t:CDS:2 [Funneliformis geosporum]|uniref:13940_t:CDS:1 n=1 Tax=Funneliformis geosporum TaxID=1117311 RepID=A0A9W4WQJ8_9GLOM|nr:19096_t:CDS:2 [Funneliformis geosporum]CAI2178911.1 13940_t:CDS:2 [Funneliformis geosporum]
MDNLAILTEGSKVYAKKRKNRIEQVPEVVFDETARRDFLTGFHKRKLERKAKAREASLQLAKQERSKARKAARESVKEQVRQRLNKLQEIINKRNGIIGQTDANESEDDEEGASEDITQESNVTQSEFRSADLMTTVTIIEDFNISDILENVSKKPRIDEEVMDHKAISPVPIPTKSLEPKSISVKKKSKIEVKKKRQPRNKTSNKTRSKTKSVHSSNSRRKKRK